MNTDYEALYTRTIDTIENNDDIFSNLLKKEDKVIDMVNRVVDQKNKAMNKASIQDATMSVVILRVFKVIFGIMKDLQEGKRLSVIFRRDRLLYLGIFLFFVSLSFIILYKIDK